MDQTFAGRTAVVTGSSGGGLGAEIARVLCARGARVVVTGRSVEVGERLARELGDTATFVAAELTRDQDCRQLIDRAAEWGGGLEILVNNAYRGAPTDDGAAWDVEPEIWDAMFRVNVRAPMLLTRAAFGYLERAGGAIVNVSSRVAQRAAPRMAAYGASKGALESLTRAIAVDGAPHGIRCNAVAPGYLLGKERDDALSERHLKALQDMHVGPIPSVADVADAVAFLASDASRSLTGAVLAVDAGGTIARARSFR